MTMALETFERAVRAYVEAIGADAVSLGTSPTGDSRLAIWDKARLKEIAESAGLSGSDIQQARPEIQAYLTGHSIGVSLEVFTRARREQDDTSDEPAEDIARKFEVVGELFDLSLHKQRVWARMTSKVSNYGRLDWEVVTKLADDDHRRPSGAPIPLAHVELRAWGPKTGRNTRSERLSFAMDEIDLEEMARGLERLREALLEAKGASDGDD